MSVRYEDYITTTTGVQGGEPVIRGTRTPVRTIVVLFQQVYPGNRDEVQRALPHLSCEAIDAALAYYVAHTDEVDALIAEHGRVLQEFTISA